MIQATLVVVGGESADREMKLNLPSILGRGRDAAVTVQHSLVSRLHCEIFEREGRLYVRDLQSLNGTYINNFRIMEEEPLLPGQLLTLGNMTFRACYELHNDRETGTIPGKPVSFASNQLMPHAACANVESSDILDGIGFLSSPQKSISVSALGNLPGAQPAVSFVGQLEGARPVADAETSSLDLDIQQSAARKTVQADDSALGSFVRKLPR